MKYILTARGNSLSGKEEFSTLLKLTKGELNLDPRDLDDAAKGAELIKRILSNLWQLSSGIIE